MLVIEAAQSVAATKEHRIQTVLGRSPSRQESAHPCVDAITKTIISNEILYKQFARRISCKFSVSTVSVKISPVGQLLVECPISHSKIPPSYMDDLLVEAIFRNAKLSIDKYDLGRDKAIAVRSLPNFPPNTRKVVGRTAQNEILIYLHRFFILNWPLTAIQRDFDHWRFEYFCYLIYGNDEKNRF